jgi:hypothetical protein
LKLKYVIFGSPDIDNPKEAIYQSFVIFPNWVDHSAIVSGYDNLMGKEPVSAGFCSISQDKDFQPVITCWGESVSLKLKSNPEKDSRYINRALRGY